MLDPTRLNKELCKALCENIILHDKGNNLWYIETPFTFPDGDTYSIYLQEINGGVRITDCGHTLMHLSYEMDIDKLRENNRGRIFEQIINDIGLKESDGQFYLEGPTSDLGRNLFRFCQAITKIHDLSFLNRFRAESTFYDDLYRSLSLIVNPDNIVKDYHYPNMADAKNYPIDYYIRGKTPSLFFVFGIPSKEKAMSTTIVLEHLLREKANFDSLLVFADQTSIPRLDLARLTNIGGEMVASLNAQDDLKRKINRYAANSYLQ